MGQKLNDILNQDTYKEAKECLGSIHYELWIE